MQTITSKDNAKLKGVRALLRAKKERQRRGCFVIEGVRALRALQEGSALPQYRLKEVWGSERAPEQARLDYCIPHELMESLSDCKSSQGLLGVVEYAAIEPAIDPESGNYLLLDRVMDPGNLGTLIRSAVAFGFRGVFLHGDCVDLLSPKTVRATMGALPFCNVWPATDELFARWSALKYEILTTVLRRGEALYTMALGPKNVLVIGNEAHGVGDAILQRATRRVSIPMAGQVESLNAAVAGSICMSAIPTLQTHARSSIH